MNFCWKDLLLCSKAFVERCNYHTLSIKDPQAIDHSLRNCHMNIKTYTSVILTFGYGIGTRWVNIPLNGMA